MTTPPRVDSTLHAADVLSGAVIDLCGVAIRLHASDERRAEAVAALFRHAELSTAPPDCSLVFVADDVAVPGSEADTTVPGAELWRPEAGLLRIRSPEGLTARSDAEAIIVGGDAASLARVFRAVALFALTHLLAQRGRVLLHGGAVLDNGHALLVLGDTGTGKSTLVFSAYRLGWPVLSDDVVAVHRHDSSVVAQGLPRPISVPQDVLNDPIAGGRLVPEDLRQRTELPSGTLATGIHPVAGVVVTTPGEQPESTLESLDGHTALRMVLQSSASLSDPALRPELFAVAAAVARLPAWSLAHGPDPASAFDDAARQLNEIRRLLRIERDVDAG